MIIRIAHMAALLTANNAAGISFARVLTDLRNLHVL